MLLFILAIAASVALLVVSSDKFVDGAASIAAHLNVSTLVIGITIIGFGTSAPEMLISTIAALDGKPELAIGNALGSNIANIALILGLTAMFVPLKLKATILQKEFPVLLITTLLVGYLIWDGYLSAIDGLVMVFVLFISLFWLVRQTRNIPQTESLDIPDLTITKAWFFTIVGLIVLVASSKLFVWGAVGVAKYFGISDLIIGLTIVAIGTSLPELSASIAAAKKQEHDLVIGNVIGSNLFNTLGVLAIPGLINPAMLSNDILVRDFPAVIGFTLLLMVFLIAPKNSKPTITKIKAIVLVSLFILYNVVLFYSFH